MGEPLAKAKIISMDDKSHFVEVNFNPKEITIDKSVTWKQKEGAMTDVAPVEFSRPSPATLSVTLHFDTYEQKESVDKKYITPLTRMALIISPDKPRPPLCLFSWGEIQFKGVIETLQIKYTMFLRSGTPVRAECTLKMKAAKEISADKPKTSAKPAAED